MQELARPVHWESSCFLVHHCFTPERPRTTLLGSGRPEERSEFVAKWSNPLQAYQCHSTRYRSEDQWFKSGFQDDGEYWELLVCLWSYGNEETRSFPDGRSLRWKQHTTGELISIRYVSTFVEKELIDSEAFFSFTTGFDKRRLFVDRGYKYLVVQVSLGEGIRCLSIYRNAWFSTPSASWSPPIGYQALLGNWSQLLAHSYIERNTQQINKLNSII